MSEDLHQIEIDQQEIDALRAQNADLVAALEEFIDAAQYDALMEGPKFKGWNRSQLDRALKQAKAALAETKGDGE
jgi:hypothetical protein